MQYKTYFHNLWQKNFFHKSLIILFIIVIWQLGALYANNSLIFPTAFETFHALWDGIISGTLLYRLWSSFSVLLVGFFVGILIAAILTCLAVSSRLGNEILSVLTSIFNPLPSVALLPIALLWFGLGTGSLLFVLLHAVIWSMALNMQYGFAAVSPVLRMAGQNLGIKGSGFVIKILIPAAFPSILSGLKVAWAFAWRTLIGAELVFGVSSGTGGIGWFIYENRNTLETANVFAGLITIIIFGFITEILVFEKIESATLRKWGIAK